MQGSKRREGSVVVMQCHVMLRHVMSRHITWGVFRDDEGAVYQQVSVDSLQKVCVKEGV